MFIYICTILYHFNQKITTTPLLLITLTVYIWLHMYVDDVLCTNLNKISVCLSVCLYHLRLPHLQVEWWWDGIFLCLGWSPVFDCRQTSEVWQSTGSWCIPYACGREVGVWNWGSAVQQCAFGGTGSTG